MPLLLSCSRRLCTKAIAARYLSQQIARNGRIRIPWPEVDQDSFEAAGIRRAVAASLYSAFPNVRKPTAMQRKLIRAITKNRDILLQDDTGTGKSFAAMLALLSRFPAQQATSVEHEDKDRTGKAPAGLLIVPHRDLAYQYLHWIHHMTLSGDAPPSLTKYAQVLVRHVDKSTLRGLPVRMQEAIRSTSSDQDQLVQQPPRILIATPNAVLELFERHSEMFRLATPSTVVVDEVDALLRVPSSKLPKERRRASWRKLRKHVPDLVQILDRLYSTFRDERWIHQRSNSGKNRPFKHNHAVPAHRPQLIMISATLRNTLQNALSNTFRWIRPREVLKLIRKRSSAQPSHRLGRSAVHHVLVVSKTGDIKNIVGARPTQPNVPNVSGSVTLLGKDDDREDGFFYDDDNDPELVDEAEKELLHAPLAFDPVMLEAVAATLALDVPRIALLVLPATAAVRKIIFELRQLGVNAHPLDLGANEASRTHVLSGIDEVSDEDPVLIVATLATVRGIDLPDLSHVLMLGVPERPSGDAYLHVAGRVGRFGRRGKVITIVEEHKEERRGHGLVLTDCSRRMSILLSQIGIQASRLEHFD